MADASTRKRAIGADIVRYAALNEAIDFERHAIFIAIPKTGTSSIRTQMRPEGKPMIGQPHLNIRQVRDLIYPFLLTGSLSANLGFPTARSVRSDDETRALARRAFERFFKFASVRNPWARTVSIWARREGIQPKNTVSFPDFARAHRFASDTCVHPTRHRTQADWLKDESGALAMDYIFKLEEIASALDTIRAMTDGRLDLAAKHGNRNVASPAARYRELYDDETRKIIAKQFEEDIDLFGYTF